MGEIAHGVYSLGDQATSASEPAACNNCISGVHVPGLDTAIPGSQDAASVVHGAIDCAVLYRRRWWRNKRCPHRDEACAI